MVVVETPQGRSTARVRAARVRAVRGAPAPSAASGPGSVQIERAKEKACARAENAPSAGNARARALCASNSIVAAGVAVAPPRLKMSNMLKSSLSLCMLKKLSLCALLGEPVSRRRLCARASAVRVRRNWRREWVSHTHHEKHVGAVDAMQQEQQRDATVEQSVLRAENAALVEVVDGGAGAVRDFARLGLTAETRSHGTAPCRPRRHC